MTQAAPCGRCGVTHGEMYMTSVPSCVNREACKLRIEVAQLKQALKSDHEERNLWARDVLAIAKALRLVQPDADNLDRAVFPSTNVMIEEILRLRALADEDPPERE